MEKAILHRDNSVLQVLLGGISALCISLVLILVFALILRFVALDASFIMPINQIIKIISIFIGVITVFKKNKSKGFVKGVFIGLVYSVAAYLIFGILSMTVTFSIMYLIDVLCCMLIGGISGIIAVNV